MDIRTVRLWSAVLLLAFIPAGCARRHEPPRDWSAEVRQLERKYVPDSRLAVFRVTVNSEPGRILVSGEVDNAAAKQELLDRIASVSSLPVVDRVLVLPDPALGGRDCAIVNVAVGNVRRKPEHWAELVTQVLLGQRARILKSSAGWRYVQVPDGYVGWIDDDALLQTDRQSCARWETSDTLIVTDHDALLRQQPQGAALPVSDLTVGDLLRRTGQRGSWVEAQMPDGRTGFVGRQSVTPYSEWKASRRATPEAIESSARLFMGAPYLWGGTSARGFDCSGFVKTVFMLNGVDLLRDADQQARGGREVEPGEQFANLKRGDLLFFGRKRTDEKPERIQHVGIYLSERNFIHCSGRVRISSLDAASTQYDKEHTENFIRARRVIGAAPGP